MNAVHLAARTCACCGSADLQAIFRKDATEYSRCRGCGVVRATAPALDRSTQRMYESIYQHKSGPNPLTVQRYRGMLARLEPFRQNGRLLEIGCGRGYFLEVARNMGWATCGTETSREGQRFAVERNLEVFLGELEQAPYPAGHFDVIVLLEVLEHLVEPTAYLRAAHRLLRPGGAVFLSTPNVDGISGRLLGSDWRVFSTDHLHLFNRRALRAALEDAGFGLLGLECVNFDPLELSRKLRRRLGGHAPADGRARQAELDLLRENVYSRPWLQAAKEGMNLVLRISGLGDTIYALAQARS